MTRPDTLKQIADYFDGLSTLFTQLAAESATAPASAAGPAAATPAAAPASFSDGTPVDEPEEWQEFSPAPLPQAAAPDGPQGFDAICPKHRREYKDGRYGPYCTAQSDDPAWANKRGYCNISPKNAHVWLRHQAAA